jgi:hypothetical protein
MMKALSLSQPWCWSLFDPIADKGVENRSWPCPIAMIGQMIAIHAAKSWDDKGIKTFFDLGLDHFPARRDMFVTSAIVGVATIEFVVTPAEADRLPLAQQRWFFGDYGWFIPKRVKLPKPIVCGGKQGLWTVDSLIENGIHQQLGQVN